MKPAGNQLSPWQEKAQAFFEHVNQIKQRVGAFGINLYWDITFDGDMMIVRFEMISQDTILSNCIMLLEQQELWVWKNQANMTAKFLVAQVVETCLPPTT